MGHQGDTVERKVARIAGRAHGIVTRRELLTAGVTPREITGRLEKGALHREYRGVYRVGHRAPSILAQYTAAVKACGDGALLCGLAAAHLLGLIKAPPSRPEVLVPTNKRIERITIRRTRVSDPRDATTHRGIPATTVPRTLVDLAAVLTADELARACHEAGVKHRTTPRYVEEVFARRPTAPGAGTLRAILTGDMPVTLSALERRFLQLLTAEGLPLPITNRPAGTKRVDCRWPEHRLTVELDSYRFHNSRHAWEQDRRREREAYARGDAFRRFTYGDVFEDSGPMFAELHPLLSGGTAL